MGVRLPSDMMQLVVQAWDWDAASGTFSVFEGVRGGEEAGCAPGGVTGLASFRTADSVFFYILLGISGGGSASAYVQ